MSVHAVSHPTPQVHHNAPPSKPTTNNNKADSAPKSDHADTGHKVNIKA